MRQVLDQADIEAQLALIARTRAGWPRRLLQNSLTARIRNSGTGLTHSSRTARLQQLNTDYNARFGFFPSILA